MRTAEQFTAALSALALRIIRKAMAFDWLLAFWMFWVAGFAAMGVYLGYLGQTATTTQWQTNYNGGVLFFAVACAASAWLSYVRYSERRLAASCN